MSYFNQPDHEQLERRDPDAQGLLIRLAGGRTTLLAAPAVRRPTLPPPLPTGGDPTSAWLAYARAREIPAVDATPLEIDTQSVPLVWRSHYVAALLDENPTLVAQLEGKGFAVVVLGISESTWPEATTTLAKLLGRAE